jgi:hypothetical protein
LRRHQITESTAVGEALGLARSHWPDEAESKLVARLIVLGADVLRNQDAAARSSREQAWQTLCQRFAGTYQPGYLTELRADWPA